MKWNISFFLVFVVSCALWQGTFAIANSRTSTYHYKIQEFEVPMDHFNLDNDKTFKIRYLYNDLFIDKHSDLKPIFFYTGNKGDIEFLAENIGFMWELAKDMKAYVVFAEHRFYGKSLPFGASTLKVTEKLDYLSVEQVLEDFAMLIRDLTDGKTTMPVVAFGGSYGGMLAAWLRMKYPHLVVGALASSAPILQLNDASLCNEFARITTSVFTSYSANCSWNIQKSWNMLILLAIKDDGFKELNAIFNFCDPLKDLVDIFSLFECLFRFYAKLATTNHPYGNGFLAPRYPVREFCRNLEQQYTEMELVNALRRAFSVYSKFTATEMCLKTSSDQPNMGDELWEIQSCYEMVMPYCSKDTMFMDKKWNFKGFSDNCFSKFKLRPKLNDITLRYGGRDMSATSNIIFSNGLLDPWSGGGVLRTDNDKITIILIPEAAHCLDLLGSNPNDPCSVLEARKQETRVIGEWINFKK